MDISQLIEDDGVLVSASTRKKFAEFENAYLTVRSKEHRLLGVAEVCSLPFVAGNDPDAMIWKVRRKSQARFLRHIAKRKNLRILDAGCGNGYFSNRLAILGHRVTALDVNLYELKLGVKAFGTSSITWLCLDLCNEPVPTAPFDLIIFNASFQYFQDAKMLLRVCKTYLSTDGEIHIIDSPFYNEAAKTTAAERSADHFTALGAPQLARHYHHHGFDVFAPHSFAVKYTPRNLLKKLLGLRDSPFPWIVIQK